jgi:hypothetical protein
MRADEQDKLTVCQRSLRTSERMRNSSHGGTIRGGHDSCKRSLQWTRMPRLPAGANSYRPL